MRKTRFLTLVAICTISLTAYAGHWHKHGYGKHSPAMMKELLRDADLSDQQVRRIEILHAEVEKKNLELRHQLEKIRLEIEQHMNSYDVDQATVFGLVEKAYTIKLQKRKNWIGFKLNMRKEMTEAQWQKVRELHAEKAKYHKRHKDCGHKGHHHKGPKRY